MVRTERSFQSRHQLPFGLLVNFSKKNFVPNPEMLAYYSISFGYSSVKYLILELITENRLEKFPGPTGLISYCTELNGKLSVFSKIKNRLSFSALDFY